MVFPMCSPAVMLAFLAKVAAAEVQHSLVLLQARASVFNSTSGITAQPTEAMDCSELPVNQLPGLVPKKGVLLGSVLANWSDYMRVEKFSQIGKPDPSIQVWRMYKDLDKVDEWFYEHSKEQQKRKLDEGQILWFDVFPRDWTLCAAKGCDQYFLKMAELLKSIKPAQAFVSIGHEIDHDWPNQVGTSEDYVKMARRAKDVIVEAGADNAVFKFSVSNQILDPNECEDCESWSNMMARWPGDDYVDWMGINIYLKYAKQNGEDTASYVYGETYRTSKMGHSLHDQLTLMTEKLRKASKPGHDFASKTWEISTVGVHRRVFDENFSDKLGNENLGVPDEFRVEFMRELKEVFNSGEFPQYKMVAYFDSFDCIVENEYTPLVESFYDFSASPAFAQSHTCS